MQQFNLIFTIMGLLLFLVGYIGFYLDRQFFQRAIKVPGKIVDYEKSENNEGKSMYRAVINYEFMGKTQTITSAICTSWKPKIGNTQQIGIDPINPQKVRIYSKIPVLWWSFMGIGMGMIIVGFFDYIKYL